jgi:hypothetical protein
VFAFHAYILWLMFFIVEYIVYTPPKFYLDNVCNKIQVHHTWIYCEGVCSIYFGCTHINHICCSLCEYNRFWYALVALCYFDHNKYNLLYAIYSWISCILVTIIYYINPLVKIVINYQNGGDCKGTLPLSVFLVINDNPYGLMFSLSFTWRNCPLEVLEVHVLD